jgi:hypothetical protein
MCLLLVFHILKFGIFPTNKQTNNQTTNRHPISLRKFARNLFELDALQCGVKNTRVRGCIALERYWSAHFRYVEFLYLFSLVMMMVLLLLLLIVMKLNYCLLLFVDNFLETKAADSTDPQTMYEYAVFLNAFNQRPLKVCWLLARSLTYPNFENEGMVAETLV